MFVERDESHFVPVVEVSEVIDFRGAELGNMREESKPQVIGTDFPQESRIQCGVFGPPPTDQHALAASSDFVQLA